MRRTEVLEGVRLMKFRDVFGLRIPEHMRVYWQLVRKGLVPRALDILRRGGCVRRELSKLVRDHGFRWGYTWTKAFLHGRGLGMPAARRRAHRRKRPRRPMAGMMLHQDASKHRWREARFQSQDAGRSGVGAARHRAFPA